jgi:hypothetical protein
LPSGARSGCTSAQTPRPRGASGDRACIPCTVARTARPPGALGDRACSARWEASTRSAGRGPQAADRAAHGPRLPPGRLTQASSTHPARGHDVSAVALAWEGAEHAPRRDDGGACSDPAHRPHQQKTRFNANPLCVKQPGSGQSALASPNNAERRTPRSINSWGYFLGRHIAGGSPLPRTDRPRYEVSARPRPAQGL